MITIEDGKRYCLYSRTNKRVKWRYAEYGGRYASYEDAIASAGRHANGEPVQIRIEDMYGEVSDVIMDLSK